VGLILLIVLIAIILGVIGFWAAIKIPGSSRSSCS
jgi:hypothetical protein